MPGHERKKFEDAALPRRLRANPQAHETPA
jgi:hypothetical protein